MRPPDAWRCGRSGSRLRSSRLAPSRTPRSRDEHPAAPRRRDRGHVPPVVAAGARSRDGAAGEAAEAVGLQPLQGQLSTLQLRAGPLEGLSAASRQRNGLVCRQGQWKPLRPILYQKKRGTSFPMGRISTLLRCPERSGVRVIRFGPWRESFEHYRTQVAGRVVREHDPHAVHRRGPEGQLGPSRPAAGRRADGLRAVAAPPAPQPARPALAGPRPLRAVGRARLHAALLRCCT